MKRILILTYFFPPSNFAGSYRIASFAKYFHKFGYYPIIITRHATENAGSFGEMAQDCGKDITHSKENGYEIYYLPYKGNLRDRIYAKYGDLKFVHIRRILSFFEMLMQSITPFSIPYSNLYEFSNKYLSSHKNIQLIITSGKPFQLFLFAHLLSKKHKIPWIADYRDEWNSRYPNNNFKIHWREKIYFLFESRLEKRWTRNIAFATTPTEKWAEHISSYLGKPCHVVMNGFEPEIFQDIEKSDIRKSINDELTVLHLGSLYEWQPIEIFISAVSELLKGGFKIRCIFPGILNEAINEKRIIEAAGEYSKHFTILPRIPQKETIKLMSEADVFLMVGYQKFKGWMSLKVLEYLPWQKPIILCPGNVYLQEVLKNYSLAYVCNSENEVISFLHALKNKNIPSATLMDKEFINTFTRENQAAHFCQLMDHITK